MLQGFANALDHEHPIIKYYDPQMADVSTDILTVEGSSLTKFSDNTS
jgi:hypothetical protein